MGQHTHYHVRACCISLKHLTYLFNTEHHGTKPGHVCQCGDTVSSMRQQELTTNSNNSLCIIGYDEPMISSMMLVCGLKSDSDTSLIIRLIVCCAHELYQTCMHVLYPITVVPTRLHQAPNNIHRHKQSMPNSHLLKLMTIKGIELFVKYRLLLYNGPNMYDGRVSTV